MTDKTETRAPYPQIVTVQIRISRLELVAESYMDIENYVMNESRLLTSFRKAEYLELQCSLSKLTMMQLRKKYLLLTSSELRRETDGTSDTLIYSVDSMFCLVPRPIGDNPKWRVDHDF